MQESCLGKEPKDRVTLKYYCDQLLRQMKSGKLKSPFDRPPPKGEKQSIEELFMPKGALAIAEGLLKAGDKKPQPLQERGNPTPFTIAVMKSNEASERQSTKALEESESAEAWRAHMRRLGQNLAGEGLTQPSSPLKRGSPGGAVHEGASPVKKPRPNHSTDEKPKLHEAIRGHSGPRPGLGAGLGAVLGPGLGPGHGAGFRAGLGPGLGAGLDPGTGADAKSTDQLGAGQDRTVANATRETAPATKESDKKVTETISMLAEKGSEKETTVTQDAVKGGTTEGGGKGAKGAKGAKGGKGGKGTKGGRGAAATPRKHNESLKPIFWTKVDGAEAGSVWEGCQAGQLEEKVVDVSELAALFPRKGQKNTAKAASEESVATTPKQKCVTLLSHQRSQNIQILLARFKLRDAHEEVRLALQNGDTAFVSLEMSEALLKCVPTTEEAKLLSSFKGKSEELAPAERFLREINRVPRVEAKLQLLKLSASFEGEAVEVSRELRLCQSACESLLGSKSLQSLLKIILSLGNALNDGTSHVASGFKLDTLAKLSEIYGADKKTTLLRYLVNTVKSKAPEVQTWAQSLGPLPKAVECSFEGLPQRVQALQQAYAAGKTEVQRSVEPYCSDFECRMSRFLETVQRQLPCLQKELTACSAQIEALLRYFGEDPQGGFPEAEALFRNIMNFSKTYAKEAAKL